MKKKLKKQIVIGVVSVLAATAAVLVSAAAVTAVKTPKIPKTQISAQTQPNVQAQTSGEPQSAATEIVIEAQPAIGDDYSISMEKDLKPEIEAVIKEISSTSGGEWSVYVYVPSTGDVLSINQKKMQAASVIKLYIMGAVYDEYDEITKYYQYNDIPSLIESMIEISDNEAADMLIAMLGRGDSIQGRKKVSDYCKRLGLKNTVMERMMADDNIYSDNYTSTEDSGKFLAMILNGELPHSKEMMNYLRNQTRTQKIPEGLPKNVAAANKTGELDDVQNDSAIIFAGKPYILCVMSDGVEDYQPPIDAITEISQKTYKYLSPRLSGG